MIDGHHLDRRRSHGSGPPLKALEYFPLSNCSQACNLRPSLYRRAVRAPSST
jgi:hypothetical protein